MADAATSHAQQPAGATGVLVLADGHVAWGRGFGAEGEAVGEVCFNTAMTGYQEIMTDPSYAGQIVTFTFPHIGNVGANPEDIEATNPHALGCIVRQDVTDPSNFRSAQHFDAWMKANGRIGLSGIDTRALTLHLREHGTMMGIVSTDGRDPVELQPQLGDDGVLGDVGRGMLVAGVGLGTAVDLGLASAQAVKAAPEGLRADATVVSYDAKGEIEQVTSKQGSRMALQVKNLARLDDGERDAVRQRAAAVRRPAAPDPELLAVADAVDPGPQAPLLSTLPENLRGMLEASLGAAPDGTLATREIREALMNWDKLGGNFEQLPMRLLVLGRGLVLAERAVAAGNSDAELLLALTRAYALLDSPFFATQQGMFQQLMGVAAQMAQASGVKPGELDVAALVPVLKDMFARAAPLHRRTAAEFLRKHGAHPEAARVLGRLADDALRREDYGQALAWRKMARFRSLPSMLKMEPTSKTEPAGVVSQTT